MKNFPIYIIITAALWIGAALQLQADPPSSVTTLMDKLQKACQADDITAIKAMYDLDGVPQALVDVDLYMWQEYFNQNDKTSHWSFEKIEYASLEQMQADKTINQKSILSMTQPHNMGGTMYEPNLKVIGFVTVTFEQDQGKSGHVGTVLPVGYASDGMVKVVLARPTK